MQRRRLLLGLRGGSRLVVGQGSWRSRVQGQATAPCRCLPNHVCLPDPVPPALCVNRAGKGYQTKSSK